MERPMEAWNKDESGGRGGGLRLRPRFQAGLFISALLIPGFRGSGGSEGLGFRGSEGLGLKFRVLRA